MMVKPPPLKATSRPATSSISTRSKTKKSPFPEDSRKAPLPTTSPPASLLSLPEEIIAKIVSHLGRPSTLSFALVSPLTAALAEPRLWHYLDVTLPHDYGSDTYGQVVKRQDRPQGEAKKQADQRAETKYRTALREKMKQILLSGNARRMGMVRKVSLTPRSGSVPEMVLLLDFVSAHLEVLEIAGLPDYSNNLSEHSFWRLPDTETLDYRLTKANLSFPALTHVRIYDSPLRSASFLHTLFTAAQNLQHLSVDLGGSPWGYYDEDTGPVPLRFGVRTRLTSLKVDFDADFDGETQPAGTIIQLIRHSPDLRQVSLDYRDEEAGEMGLMAALCDLAGLRDLAWMMGPDRFCGLYDRSRAAGGKELACLRRLILSKGDDKEFAPIPNIPGLEVYDLFSYFWEPEGSATTPPPRMTSLLPAVAQQIRNCPLLSGLRYFERGDDYKFHDFFNPTGPLPQDRAIGQFTSLHHGNEDILIARYLIWFTEIFDGTPQLALKRRKGYHTTTIEYTANDGTNRAKVFEYLEQGGDCCLGWQVMSDYEGLAVPAEVLSRMREVEGKTEAEWTGRGIEVSDAAWKVLTDWKEAL